MEPSMPPEPLSQTDWQQTPPAVQTYLLNLHQRLAQLQQQIEQLQERSKRTSKTSDKPPSSDSPFQRPTSSQGKPAGKRGARHGHPGSGPKLLRPTACQDVYPVPCGCGQGVPLLSAPLTSGRGAERSPNFGATSCLIWGCMIHLWAQPRMPFMSHGRRLQYRADSN